MRASVNLPGGQRLPAKGEGGARKLGKSPTAPRVGSVKTKPIKYKGTNANKNQRLRSQGVIAKKLQGSHTVPMGSSSPPKSTDTNPTTETSTQGKGSPTRDFGVTNKVLPKKRSLSAGSIKTTDVSPGKDKGTKKAERGRPPKVAQEGPKGEDVKGTKVKKSPGKPHGKGTTSLPPKGTRKALDAQQLEKIAKSIEFVISSVALGSRDQPPPSPVPTATISVSEPSPLPLPMQQGNFQTPLEISNAKEKSIPLKPKMSPREKTPKDRGATPTPSSPDADGPVPRKRGRPKGSKNKVKKEGAKSTPKKSKRKTEEHDGKKGVKKEGLEERPASPGGAKGRRKVLGLKPPKVPKKTTKVLSSKALKKTKVAHKPRKKMGPKLGTIKSQKVEQVLKVASEKDAESTSEVEIEADTRRPKVKVRAKSRSIRDDSKGSRSPGAKARAKVVPKKGSSPPGVSSNEDEGPDESPKPPKKALKDKWSREHKSLADEGDRKGSPKRTQLSPRERRGHPVLYYDDESDREEDEESEDDEEDDYSPRKRRTKEARKTPKGRTRKKKKKSDEDEKEDCAMEAPKRIARMASLNAIAKMACLNEDAKVPLPVPPAPRGDRGSDAPSMALVRESTIARNHSGDESDDSEDDNPELRTPVAHQDIKDHRVGKRKSQSDSREQAVDGDAAVGTKRRRRRRRELDVEMDMKDMVVTKRMASLNASAIMAASYSSDHRTPRPRAHSAGAGTTSGSRRASSNEVTNVDIKRKISFQATPKSRSVITVQETTKKVQKAQGSRRTEVEEHIIVKKRVKRRHQSPPPDEDDDEGPDDSELDTEILPKSPSDNVSDVIMEESSTLTYMTTPQTRCVAPHTVTLSGHSKYQISSSDGRTTTVVQHLHRKSTTTTTSPPTGAPPTSTIPTAHIPPTQHVQVAHPENRLQSSRAPPNYSPLGALEVMQPVMHPPPPPSSHFIAYPPPPHGPPIHHLYSHPPHPTHHHHLPSHPSPPYPPLSPHSPPYPPPPPPPPHSNSTSSLSCTPSSSPSCYSSGGYRSPPAPCPPNGSPGGFTPPVSSPKQMGPQGTPPTYRDERPHTTVASPISTAPNGPLERHHSAFSAPTPSTHSPATASAHGYQPVSGPMPTGGSPPNASSYKPPPGSPGGSSPSPYSSPSRLTSPPPANKPGSFIPGDPYNGPPPHPYQPYPYPAPGPPYDKYYPRTPAYHLYQPTYTSGQYPQGDYSYQPPPPGTVHYSQESYTSYTLCVPAPPPHHGPAPITAGTHPSALALPPPPPTSNASLHHHTAPYATYHCTEYTPVFSYPSAGSSQSGACCPAGGHKNAPPGELLSGVPKGPDAESGVKKHPGNSSTCNMFPHYGSRHHQNQGPPGNPQQPLPHGPPMHPPPLHLGPQKSYYPPPYGEHTNQPRGGNAPPEDPGEPKKHPKFDLKQHKTTGPTMPFLQRPPHTSLYREGKPPIKGDSKSKPLPPPPPPPSLSAPLPYTNTAFSTAAPVPSDSSLSPSGTPTRAPSAPLLALATSLSSQPEGSRLPGVRVVTTSDAAIEHATPQSGVETPTKKRPMLSSGATSVIPTASVSLANKDSAAEVISASSPLPVPTCSACGDGAVVPVFPTMPDRSNTLQITTWVVQPCASPPTNSTPASNGGGAKHNAFHVEATRAPGGISPSQGGAGTPTNTTTSISLANTNSSTNSVMSTTAPVVTSLEGISAPAPKTSASPHDTIVRTSPKISDGKNKETHSSREGVPDKFASSLRAGGRHLLCQPLPLGHTKMTSVLAKAKPSQPFPGVTKMGPEESHKISHTPGVFPKVPPLSQFKPVEVTISPEEMSRKSPPRDETMEDRTVPRKRGRPPKNKEAVLDSHTKVPASNGVDVERKHFCCAPGELAVREDKVPRKRMSLLKPSGAKAGLAVPPFGPPSGPRRAKTPTLTPGTDLPGIKKDIKEDMKALNVKTEAPAKIKTENVSPKQGAKYKLLNGDMDMFEGLPEKALKGVLLPPPFSLGPLETPCQDSLKRKLKREVDTEMAKFEEKKITIKRRTTPPDTHVKGSGCGRGFPKISSLTPPSFVRGFGAKRTKADTPQGGQNGKVRRKASLLAYLKEKNESDASGGEGDAVPCVEEELQKLKEKEDEPIEKIPHSFPTYTPMAIRGRRSSGTPKGKSVRKPKYYHGWSWEGEPHEGKVWLRNDEVLMMRKCFKAMRHKEGDTIHVRDCVLLRSGPRKTDLPFVAKVAALWEDPETSDMMMSILWYYRPEHTEAGRREEDLADEIFASKHRDHLSVACIEDRCYVLTFNEYCRYRRLLRLFQEKVYPGNSPVPDSEDPYLRKERQPPGCVVQDLLFFCRKVYDYRQKRILKNPC